MIRLTVLPNSPTPAYRQIAEQIASQILSGEIEGGAPLPPIRTVARELGVSVITVRSAWDSLESDGLIITRSGSGCFAAELSKGDILERKLEIVKQPLNELIASATQMGITKKELIELIEDIY